MLSSRNVSPNKLPWQRALVTLSTVVTAAFVLAMLYWAQTVFIPLAMAVFFAFVLNPLVTILERRRLGRTASVLIVVAVAFGAVAGTAAVITQQLASLGKTMAANSEQVKVKIDQLKNRFAGDGSESDLGKMVKEIQDAVLGATAPKPARSAAARMRASLHKGGCSGRAKCVPREVRDMG